MPALAKSYQNEPIFIEKFPKGARHLWETFWEEI